MKWASEGFQSDIWLIWNRVLVWGQRAARHWTCHVSNIQSVLLIFYYKVTETACLLEQTQVCSVPKPLHNATICINEGEKGWDLLWQWHGDHRGGVPFLRDSIPISRKCLPPATGLQPDVQGTSWVNALHRAVWSTVQFCPENKNESVSVIIHLTWKI